MFLEDLRSKFPFENILLVMDQLSMHKSNDTKQRLGELGFLYTYTPVISPEFNGGMESTFSLAKRIIKQKRLEQILNNGNESLKKIIEDAFYSLS